MSGKKSPHYKRVWASVCDYFKVVVKALGKIGSDNVAILAAGMVYSTLIAIVPCVTFLSAFLSALGGLENFTLVVGEWLADTFGEEQGAFVLEKVTLFSRNAMSLGIFGLVTFIIMGSLLAVNIDSIINNIFHTRQSHGAVRRYGKIIIFLIVLSVFIAVSLSLSQSIREDVYTKIGVSDGISLIRITLKRLLRVGVIYVVFFFLLFFVPNTRVRVPSALAGSALGTVLVSLFYLLFTNLIITTVNYSVIYGSLAAILLVLLFFYVIWYIVIFVSEVTFIHQFRPEKDIEETHILTPQREIEEGLRVLVEIAKSFKKGEGGISAILISARSRVVYFRVLTYLKTLEANGFIKELTSSSYILARPAEDIALESVVDSLFSYDSKSAFSGIQSFKEAGLEKIKGDKLSLLLKEDLDKQWKTKKS